MFKTNIILRGTFNLAYKGSYFPKKFVYILSKCNYNFCKAIIKGSCAVQSDYFVTADEMKP